VEEEEYVEQPWTGFDYSYWFECAVCGTRVNIAADLYELQTTETPTRRRADFSRCAKCSAEIDVTELCPVLRSLNDIALQDDCVARLYWYHSSPYENWPDAEAYAAAFEAQIAKVPPLGPFTPQQLLEQHTSLAAHIGTYEAAIENMLRRRRDQDRQDGSPVQYWLHRVQIKLKPGDLAPDVGEELADFMGNVPLSMVHGRFTGRGSGAIQSGCVLACLRGLNCGRDIGHRALAGASPISTAFTRRLIGRTVVHRFRRSTACRVGSDPDGTDGRRCLWQTPGGIGELREVAGQRPAAAAH
jgi:hypothetical protein